MSGRIVSLYTGRGVPDREVVLKHFQEPEQIARTDGTGAYRFASVAADKSSYELRVRRQPIREFRLRETAKGASVTSLSVEVKGTPKDVGTLIIEDHEQDVHETFVPVCQTGQPTDVPLLLPVLFLSGDGKSWKRHYLWGNGGQAPFPALVCIESKKAAVGRYISLTDGRAAGTAYDVTWVVRLYRPPDSAVLRTTVHAAEDPTEKLRQWYSTLH